MRKHPRIAAQEPIERARAAWTAGELDDAARVLERILNRNPDDAAAIHLAGAVALAAQQPAQAAVFLEKAVQLNPENADFWCDLGTALHALRNLGAAEQAYRQTLVLQASHKDGLFNLANVLR
ncbi:MAG: tetratricopeptide repeat protein, partial [Burkholderiales bacterium]